MSNPLSVIGMPDEQWELLCEIKEHITAGSNVRPERDWRDDLAKAGASILRARALFPDLESFKAWTRKHLPSRWRIHLDQYVELAKARGMVKR